MVCHAACRHKASRPGQMRRSVQTGRSGWGCSTAVRGIRNRRGLSPVTATDRPLRRVGYASRGTAAGPRCALRPAGCRRSWCEISHHPAGPRQQGSRRSRLPGDLADWAWAGLVGTPGRASLSDTRRGNGPTPATCTSRPMSSCRARTASCVGGAGYGAACRRGKADHRAPGEGARHHVPDDAGHRAVHRRSKIRHHAPGDGRHGTMRLAVQGTPPRAGGARHTTEQLAVQRRVLRPG